MSTSEAAPCGCAWETGTWDFCVYHRALYERLTPEEREEAFKWAR